MTLDIIIVNYNVKHYLWQCLDSVRRASQGLDVETWVVDNASTDGSVPFLRESFPDVHFIENTENVGFARANNQAIQASSGDLVLLLNPDTFMEEDALTHCIDFFEQHLRAGAVGVHMVNRDGSFARESRRGLPTPATAFFKIIGLGSLFPKSPLFARYHMGHLPEFADVQIEAISGAFMMLRREALEQAGLLDETFFMYGEDIDLSYRIGKADWELWYTPAMLLHYKGESTQQTSFRYVYNFYNAMLIFFRKNFSRRYWYAWLFVELAVLMMGFLSMCRIWLYQCLLNLRKMFACSTENKTEPAEQMAFIGSDEAWTMLQALCEHEHLPVTRVYSISEVSPKVLFMVFEVAEYKRCYHSILWQMTQAFRDGKKLIIGTFNVQNGRLILPHDVFC